MNETKTLPVTVEWTAFGDRPEKGRWMRSATIEVTVPVHALAEQVCEMVYRDTNLYCGTVWDALQPVLPTDRTHTALSEGDHVTVDGDRYRCAEFGFDYVGQAVSA
jgi:hypothetical protein